MGRILQLRVAAAASLLALAIALTAPAAAQTPPADSTIRAVTIDLDKVRQELPSLTPQRTANIVRLRRTLDNAEQMLDRSPNKEHASYKEAAGRIVEYRRALEAVAAGGAPAAPPAQAPQQAAPQPAAPAPAQQAPRLTSSGQAQLARLDRNAEQALAQLDATTPRQLHAEDDRTSWARRIEALQRDAAGFDDVATMPEVQAAHAKVAAAATRFGERRQAAEREVAALGDIPAKVAEIEGRYAPDRLPKPLDPPYAAERVAEWGNALVAFAGQAQADAGALQGILDRTDLQQREVKNSLNATLGHRAKNALDEALSKTRTRVREPIAAIERRLDFLLAITPDDSDKLRNNLLREGQYDELVGQLDAGATALETGKLIEAALGLPAPADADALLDKVARTRTHVAALHGGALAAGRMPKPRTTDPKLFAIAAETLKNPSYGVKPWRRLVINSEMTTRQEKRGSISGNTITVHLYDWDQFQVATAEQVDGKWYVYYNTLKFFRSGGTTTPLNRWILSDRFQSAQILEANID